MSLRVVVVAVVLLLAGCGQERPGVPKAGADVMPADFAGTVSYGNGSVPPPYHFEWRLTFDTTSATVEWTPGYSDVEPWRESVEITEDDRRALYDELRDAGVLTYEEETDEGLAGGSTGSIDLVVDGERRTSPLGTSRAGQDVLEDVVAAVEDLVPAEAWTRLRDRQDEWSARQPE
jgi:hypothetical protein